MMTFPQPARPVILRARRDTIGLVVTATLATFALAHTIQSHRIAMPQDAPRQVWTGGLTGVAAPNPTVAESEPVTSASLVVPEAELALPQAPMRALVKLRGCGGDGCMTPASRTASVPTPPRRLAAAKPAAEQVASLVHPAGPHQEKRSLISRLNPLDRLPGASSIKRPFTFASDTVSGWFKRF